MTANRNKKKPTEGAGRVAFVGGGPGDPELLTVRAARLLGGADTVVGPAAALGAAAGRIRPGAETLATDDLPPATVSKTLLAAARDGRRVVRLVPDDPGLSAAVVEEADACAKAQLPFEVAPGVPAGLGVAAYAGVLPAAASAGGRGPARGPVLLVDAAAVGEPLPAVLADRAVTLVATGTPVEVGRLVGALVAAGRADGPASLTLAGSTTDQYTVDTDLPGAAKELTAAAESGPAVLVAGPVAAERHRFSWYESKPLFGWRVLVPRTREQAGDLCDRLRSYGAVPIEVPTIAVEPPRTPQAMDRAISGLVSGRYQWVAFTSTNAVRAVREKLEELGLDARAFAGVQVAVIGETTGAAVEQWGIRPDLVPSGQQSSEGLLADWPEYEGRLEGLDRVFLPRADIATETLVAGLTERGWQVDDVTAYRTVRASPPPAETREAIKTGGFDAVLFTSSSTVRNLVGIAGKPHASTVIAAIGPQTARTAEELGLRVDVVAESPSALRLADALADFGAERRLSDDQPPGKANRARIAARGKRAK
jgi:uroporphyrinogen III methyltransferase/synthase